LKILLDTNALIWLLDSAGGKPFGPHAKQDLKNAGAVYASSVNLLEIRIKAMLGKLVAPAGLQDAIAASGLVNLSFGMEHADAISNFPALSKHDPFDRMLLAQAQTESMFLLTSDRFLIGQGLDFVLSARD